MKLSIVAFETKVGDSIEEQAVDCMEQLSRYISGASLTGKNIIAINFFISAFDKETYHEHVSNLEKCLPSGVCDDVPVAYLAQAPANGTFVSAEIHYISDLGQAVVRIKEEQGNKYLVIENEKGEKLVIANGIGEGHFARDITQDSEWVFSVMDRILKSEDLNFSHIFRQWNYIEDITYVDPGSNGRNQHYQQFNNVRSKYYATADFLWGYPAATGIGTSAGGVIVSFYAVAMKGFTMYSVENPLQRAAFEYSEEVLIGKSDYEGFIKCTPKFSRAKFVSNSKSEQIFVSGTASIREEKTVGNDVVEQTEITLDNIEKLISKESISEFSAKKDAVAKIDFIRVYIKYAADYLRVKAACENRLPGIPAIYVVSDVCRDNLLVEIEALATV